MGHSACKIAQAEEAVTKGASSITHLFNAMQAVSSKMVTIKVSSPCVSSFIIVILV
jgi:N-acetylglucosamine-6-phosphate deacetylase